MLLLGLNKTETTLFLLTHMLYKNMEDKGRVYKIEDLEELSGLSRSDIIKGLGSLETKNIIGKLTFEQGLVEKKIVKGFSEEFTNTLYDRSNPVKDATDRVGYHIADDDFAYVLNPCAKSWKYPAKAKMLKAINRLEKIFDKDDFIKYLKNSLKKKGGRRAANSTVGDWNVHGAIQKFVTKYKEYYNANYVVDKKLEYRLMRNVLIILSSNKVSKDDLPKFLDFAFKKAKNKKAVVHISTLKYYANEFVTNVVKKTIHSSEYYYDDQGNRYKRKAKT